MNEQAWIGIQFNLDKDVGLKKWMRKYKHLGLETDDGEHVTANFTSRELKDLSKGEIEKLKILKTSIKRYLKNSSYTNIYAYIDATSLSSEKENLLKEFTPSMRIETILKDDTLLANYQQVLKLKKVVKVLKNDSLLNALNFLFEFVANRGFEQDQRLCIELSYETLEDWGGYRDNLNVSIQLDVEEE